MKAFKSWDIYRFIVGDSGVETDEGLILESCHLTMFHIFFNTEKPNLWRFVA